MNAMKLCQLIHQLEGSKPSLRGLPVGVFCSAYYLHGFSSILIEPCTDEGKKGIAITFVGSRDEKPLTLQAVIGLLKVHIHLFGEQVLKVEHAHGGTKFGPPVLEEVRGDRDNNVVDLIFS